MIRQNFTQLISTRGTTLTNSDSDVNNDFLKKPGVLGDYTIVLTGYIGIGNTNDTIDITLNGTRMEIATGTLVNTAIESMTLNNTTSAPMSGGTYVRNIATGTTTGFNARTPGVLVFGYGIKKTLF
jgi:hypothetical protein